ncbi:MAG: FMN-binding protein [Clostridia bacterium]|nr:FMN-binding protein [Clostridia bacterium]
MKSKIMPSVVLGSICLVVALLLSVVNMFTAPVIEDALNQKNLAAMKEVLPNATELKQTNVYDGRLDKSIKNVYEGPEGYVFQVSAKGYSSAGMTIMIGVDQDGKIAGTKCTANQETPDKATPVFEKTEGGYYIGQDSTSFDPLLVSGATYTSGGYSSAVKAALDAYAIIKGGN